MDKVKPIILRYDDGKEYTLDFNRASVIYAEQRGFKRSELGDNLMTQLPELFWYAFRMHHPNVTKQQAEKILFEDLGGMSEAVADRLVDLFNAPYMSLVSEDDNPKNAQLKVILPEE